MQACHSPKCVTRACCNGAHLRWDTAGGNQADVAITGTRRGEKNPKAILTESMVRLIWARRAEGPTKVASDMGLPRTAVRHVIDGDNWGHVTRLLPSIPSPEPTQVGLAMAGGAA